MYIQHPKTFCKTSASKMQIICELPPSTAVKLKIGFAVHEKIGDQ